MHFSRQIQCTAPYIWSFFKVQSPGMVAAAMLGGASGQKDKVKAAAATLPSSAGRGSGWAATPFSVGRGSGWSAAPFSVGHGSNSAVAPFSVAA